MQDEIKFVLNLINFITNEFFKKQVGSLQQALS